MRPPDCAEASTSRPPRRRLRETSRAARGVGVSLLGCACDMRTSDVEGSLPSHLSEGDLKLLLTLPGLGL